MQTKRPIFKFPLIVGVVGVLLLLTTIHFHITLEGAHYTIPGYQVPPKPGVTSNHWMFFVSAGVLLVLLVLLLRWSVSPPHNILQQPSNIGCLLTGGAILVTFFLLMLFFFTVCA